MFSQSRKQHRGAAIAAVQAAHLLDAVKVYETLVADILVRQSEQDAAKLVKYDAQLAADLVTANDGLEKTKAQLYIVAASLPSFPDEDGEQV